MKNEDIFDAIGNIGEDMISDAASGIKKRNYKRVAIIAASVLLVACIGIFPVWHLLNPANSGGNASSGHEYMYYGGPVLPLDVLSGADRLTADRHITYDINNRGDGGIDSRVTDSYRLKNTSDTADTFLFSYPYSGTLDDSLENVPSITVDGVSVTPRIHIGNKRIGKGRAESFVDYKSALADGEYRADAYKEEAYREQKVTVYEINGYGIKGEGDNPTLKFSFEMDHTKSSVLTYGMNGGIFSPEDGRYARWFSVPAPGEYGYGRSYYIIIIGEDIKDYTLQGYEDGGCDKGEEIEITALVTRREADLLETVSSLVEFGNNGEEPKYLTDTLSEDMKRELIWRELETGQENGSPIIEGSVEGIYSSIIRRERVIYLDFEAEIPQGKSVNVTASFLKRGHEDFVGDEPYRYGYDMATALETDIALTSVKATLVLSDDLRILRQNFGFDPENGALSVALDASVEYYYIDIGFKNTKK